MKKKQLTLRELLVGYAIYNLLKDTKKHPGICMTSIKHLDHCAVSVEPLNKKGQTHVRITSGDPNEREPSVCEANVFEKDIKTPAAWLKCMMRNTRLAKAINSIPEDKESGLEYVGYENPDIMIPVVTIKSNTWSSVVGKRLLANSMATYMMEMVEKYHLSDLPGELDNPIWITPTVKIISSEDAYDEFFHSPGSIGVYMLVSIQLFTTDGSWYKTGFGISRKDRDKRRDDFIHLFESYFDKVVTTKYKMILCGLITTNVRRVKQSSDAANATVDSEIANWQIEAAMAAEIRTRMKELTGVKMPIWMVQPALDVFDGVQVTGDISKEGTPTVNLTPSTKEYAPIFSSTSLET